MVPKKIIKKRIKELVIALTLFIVTFPFIFYIETYFHETAHLKKFREYNISAEYVPEINPIKIILNFYSGGFSIKPFAKTTFNVTQMLQLNKWQKKEICMAGIYSDLFIAFIVLIIILAYSFSMLVKIFNKDEKSLEFIRKHSVFFIYINLVMFSMLSMTIYSIILNLSDPISDMVMLISSINETLP